MSEPILAHSLKYSGLWPVLMVIGLGMILVAIGNGMRSLKDYEAQLASKQNELTQLKSDIKQIDDEIDTLQHAPLETLIKPKAIGITTGKKTVITSGPDKGAEGDLVNFTLWIDVPNCRRNEIREVRYKFPHPSYLSDVRVGRDPSNGFAVSYAGWGAVDIVPVTVVKTDGGNIEIPFHFYEDVKIQ